MAGGRPDHIATEVLARVGLAPPDDERAGRWIANIENRHNLYRVSPPGQGSRRWPKAGEINKAIRQHRAVPVREQLRRLVREAATIAIDEADSFTRLTRTGVECAAPPQYVGSEWRPGTRSRCPSTVPAPAYTTVKGSTCCASATAQPIMWSD